MRIAIFGTGGVGGYFGGRLAQAGHDVTFIARGPHLDAIEQHGLRVTSPKGDFVIHPASATDDPRSVGPVDLVLLGVKAGQVSDVAPAVRHLVRVSTEPSAEPATVVVPLQNGVEAADDLVRALGAAPVLGGLCRIVTSVTGPGRISHTGVEPTIVIGELDHSVSERVTRIRDGLEAAGIAVEVPGNIHVALWEKLLLVAPWGGLGGLTGLSLDVLCDAPETRRLLERSMTEVSEVAAAQGAPLPDGTVERTARFLASLPPGGTASMQRDLMEGRPSELDTQIGAIVRLGRASAVETPVNAFVHDCLAPVERRARRTGS